MIRRGESGGLKGNNTIKSLKLKQIAETETNRERRASQAGLRSHLGDDLAILGVDLSDASPLCQKGEDLVQLGGSRRTDRQTLQRHFE